MKRKQPITETAPKTGVFTGDLRYGRMFGHTPSREDHAGEENAPNAPLVLVSQRDKLVWKHDPRVREVKKHVANSQYLTNGVIERYLEATKHTALNVRLTVGRQRL